jgi:hypothetical protein
MGMMSQRDKNYGPRRTCLPAGLNRYALLPLKTMASVGLEPTCPCGHGILSPARLPFHHEAVKLEVAKTYS